MYLWSLVKFETLYIVLYQETAEIGKKCKINKSSI